MSDNNCKCGKNKCSDKDFVQAVNNDGESIELGEKIEKLLSSQNLSEIDVLDEVPEGMVRVELPNGLYVMMPADKHKSSQAAMDKMMTGVESEEITSESPEFKKNDIIFETKDGVQVNLGDGPAVSEYRPGMLRKHKPKTVAELRAERESPEAVEANKAEMLERQKKELEMIYTRACKFLPIGKAILVPFVVLWRKLCSILTTIGLYGPK